MIYTILSWLSTCIFLIGAFAIGNKRRWAFVCFFAAEIMLVFYSIHIRAWAVVVVGVMFAVMAVRNYLRWGKL
jgi:hypothetical protein